MRRAAKVDDNQTSVLWALRKSGCKVLIISVLGDGCPDLLVNRAGDIYMLELKDGDKPPSRRKLTPQQKEFHRDWPVHTVTNKIEALEAVGLIGYEN